MEPKILIPYDDSPTAKQTIESVIQLKERFPKKLYLLYVINKDQLAYRMIPDFQLEMVQENAQRLGKVLLEKVAGKLEEAGFEIETILELGAPRHVIANVANTQYFQLVVLGRHEGGGEIRDVLFGSVANFVLHNVKCPVLLF